MKYKRETEHDFRTKTNSKNNPANREEAFILAAFDMFEQLYRTSLIEDDVQRQEIFTQHLKPLVATLVSYNSIP
jgi:hypothetical protein